MSDDIAVYVSVLQRSLQDKSKVLQQLLVLTQKQEEVLNQKELDSDAFDALLEEKEALIGKMQELDQGFQRLFDKISVSLKAEKQQYKKQILEMQKDIRTITDCSVKIQALEQKNKEKFATFAAQKRKEIRNFRVNNRTATSYYQNMANQHHEWQTYFLDKKK